MQLVYVVLFILSLILFAVSTFCIGYTMRIKDVEVRSPLYHVSQIAAQLLFSLPFWLHLRLYHHRIEMMTMFDKVTWSILLPFTWWLSSYFLLIQAGRWVKSHDTRSKPTIRAKTYNTRPNRASRRRKRN